LLYIISTLQPMSTSDKYKVGLSENDDMEPLTEGPIPD